MRQLLVIVSSLVMSGAAFCTEIHVPADQPSIQAGINAAVDGDTVIISPGRYVENIDFLGKAITVRSTDPLNTDVVAATIIDGNQSGTCVTFRTGEDRDSVISGFTITNGGQAVGGGVRCEYSHGAGSSPTICNNTIAGNTQCGVFIDIAGYPLVLNNTISWNDGLNAYGGGLWSYGSAVVVGNIFEGNSAISGGGAICCIDPRRLNLIIVNNRCVGNTGRFGSAICVLGYCEDAMIAGNVIDGNGNDDGRETVYIDGTRACVAGNEITHNNDRTVLFCFDSTVSISANVILSNDGAGVFVGPSPRASVADMTGNIILWNKGPGVQLSNSPSWVSGNLIAGNQDMAVYCSDSDCAFINNTVMDNGISMAMGGILLDGGSSWSIHNCLMRENGAAGADQIRLTYWSQNYIPHVSIDHSNIEGGIDSIDVKPGATLVWGPGNIDADARFVRPGRWDDAGTPDDPSDDVYVPGDYRLLPGSPCIDAGTNDVDNPDTPEVETLPATDIAGVTRVIDGDFSGTATVDIGAYEFLPGDADGDGRVTLIDLLRIRNSLGLDPSSSPEARLADVNGDGAVNMVDLLLARRQFQGR